MIEFKREVTGAPWRTDGVEKRPVDDFVRRMHEAGVAATPREPVGVQSLKMLAQRRILPWRGVIYDVPPIPFHAGMDMDLALSDIAKLDTVDHESTRQMRRLVRSLLSHFRSLSRPRGWRRFVWRILPNPFRDATHHEIKDLVDFFSACRRTTAQPQQTRSQGPPSLRT